MQLKDTEIRALLEATRNTRDLELDCEAFLDRVSALAEARAEGRAIPAGLEQVSDHERLCANCREELSALVQMLETQR